MKATQELHDLGQSLWLDNITRDDARRRDARGLHQRPLGHRPDVEPDDLREGYLPPATPTTSRSTSSANRGSTPSRSSSRWRSQTSTAPPISSRPSTSRTDGVDGFVSLEVSPKLAYDTDATVSRRAELHAKAERDNLYIKIPGTPEGLPAIEESIFAGIPVNVTLLFSSEQHLAAADAYMKGIERRIEAGLDPTVESVASLFMSRWDVAVARTGSRTS